MTSTLLWNEAFSLGIPEIDTQHQYLFSIYHSLDEIQNETAQFDRVKAMELLKHLEEYAKFHFSTEEQLLQQAGCSEYEKQCKSHALFSKTIGEFAKELSYENPHYFENLLIFIKKWLISHILKQDRAYRACLLAYLNGQ